MKFTIITHVIHKEKNNCLFAYEPYVREMNLWLKNVSETKIVAPFSNEDITKIESVYKTEKISINKIFPFNVLSLKGIINSIFKIPLILREIYKAMCWADHIHLRCPGNIGLLGCFVQIFFPKKPKTVKYAGNWDPKSKQPWSYRLQKWIVSNTFLTKNCKVLVYGQWKNQSKNVMPFFTASYTEKEILKVTPKSFEEIINFIFVGTFSIGKQPLVCVKVVQELYKEGNKVRLDMYGNGSEFKKVKDYIRINNLEDIIFLHGNQSKEMVKKAFKNAHFLIFISKSEGWPKVVAEAMFWECLPISKAVSCVPMMLDNGNRGGIVSDSIDEIVTTVKGYIINQKKYKKQVIKAKKWSQQFTLEKFEKEIKKLLT